MDEQTPLAWRKSTYSFSNSNCLEWAWRKPARSESNGHCTEAAVRGGDVLVRDSKLGAASPVLAFAPGAWREFLASVKAQ